MSMRARIHAVTALALAVAGCGDNRPTGPETLRIDPPARTVPAGLALTLTAVYEADGVAFPAGDEVAWTSSNLLVATVTAGDGGTAIVRGVASGPVAITARAGRLASGAAIFVGPPVPAGLALVPPSVTFRSGECAVVAAHVTQSDGTITIADGTRLQWSGETGILQVGFDGTICANQPGTDTLTARLGDLIATAAVEVTAPKLVSILATSPPPIPVGRTGRPFTTAFYADGTSQEIHDLATWTVDDPALASITSPGGVITGLAPGELSATATFASMTTSCPVLIVERVLERLEVTPPAPTVAVGATLQLTATAFFELDVQRDVSADASWLSGSPAVATVSPSGLVTALAPGASVVSARYQARTAAVFVTVTD